MQPEAPKVSNAIRVSLLGSRGIGIFALTGLLLAAIAIGVTIYFTRNNSSSQPADKVSQQAISLEELAKSGNLAIDSGGQLSINGQLRVNDSLILTPQDAPAKPITGQLYIDKTSGKLLYYDGTKFIASSGSESVSSVGGATGAIGVGSGLVLADNTISNAGVVSLQGQTGDVNFNAGPGITISGTTIGNSGVVSVGGLKGSLDLGVGLAASGTTLSNTGVTSLGNKTGELSVGNGLSFSGNTLNNTGILSLTSLSANLVVTDGGGGSYTIADTNVGAGGNVSIGPAAAQNDPGVTGTPTVWLNKAGAGNLLQLSTGAIPTTTNRFVVDNSGVIITGHIGWSQVDSKPNFVNTFGGDPGDISVGSGLTYNSGTKTVSNGGITSVTNGVTTTTGQISIGSGLSLTGATISATGSGVGSVAGTANQVSVSSATGNVTISLPQDIAASSTPSFTALKLGSGANVSTFSTSNTAPRTISVPNASGTLAVSASGNVALDAVGNLTLTGIIPVSSGGTGISTAPTDGQLLIGNTATGKYSQATLTQGAGVTITNGNGTITIAAPGVGSCASCASTDLSNLAVTTAISQTLQPSVTNAVDLGTTTKRFANLYLGSGANVSGALNVGGAVTLSNLVTNGVVTVSGGILSSSSTLSILNGGTGASSAGAALTALGGAARGANGDITSLTTLTAITPGAALTVGATTKTLTLQGDSGTVITANAGASFTKLAFTLPTSTNTITFPNSSGTVCLNTGSSCGSTLTGLGGASQALDNLSGVAISQSLVPGAAGTIDLGSTTKPFAKLYLSGTSGTPGTNNFTLTGTATVPRTLTLPDADGTLCIVGGSGCGGGGGGASQLLDNLNGPTAINQTLQPGVTNTIDLGTSALRFKNLYLSGNTDLTGTLTVASTVKISSLGTAGVVVNAADGTLSSTNGALPVSLGGTGSIAVPTNGQLLIGNGTDYSVATLTQGAGVTITNAAGTITIAATGAGTCASCAQADLSNLAVITAISQTLQPSVTNTVDLGTTTKKFANLYLGSNATITGNLTVSGSTKLSGLGSAGIVLNAADGTLSSTNGALPVTNGGTGTASTPSDGQLLIGNTATGKYSQATLAQGSGVTITNGNGTITIAASGGGTCASCAQADLSNLAVTTLISQNLQPSVTNAVDLGSATKKFANLYLGSNASIGGTLNVTGVVTLSNLATNGVVTVAGGVLSSSATLPISAGGTGISATPTDGQLLIGNTLTSGYTKATLVQGSGVTITNGNGTITIAATGAGTCASCAQADLSNLAVNTAISQTLQPSVTNTVDLGTTTKRFANLYLGSNASINGTLAVSGSVTLSSLATNGVVTVSGGVLSSSSSLAVGLGGTGLATTPTTGKLLIGNNTGGYSLNKLTAGTNITIDDTTIPGQITISDTLAGTCSSCAPGTGGSGYIWNSASIQSGATFYIQNSGRSDLSLLAPVFDIGAAGILKVGNTTATSIEIGKTSVTTTIKGPLTVESAQLLSVKGATINTSLSFTPSGNGDIATNLLSVDIGTYFLVSPTVAGLTLTLPTPSSLSAGRLVYITNNSGSNSFGMYGVTSDPGTTQSFVWNGSAWTVNGSGTTGNYIANQSSLTTPQSLANLAIQGSARVDTVIYAPTIDTYSAQALNIGSSPTPTLTQINLNQNTQITGNLTFARGADRTITVNSSTVAATAGGALGLQAGAGFTSGAGGALTLQGGTGGGASGNGGKVTITGGNAGNGNSNGGDILLQPGYKQGTGTSGNVIVKAQASNDSTSLFQVQNAAATSLFSVDSTVLGGRVTVGTTQGTPTGQLYVPGTMPTSAVGSVTTNNNTWGSTVVGRYAYIVSFTSGTLQVVDVSNPANPVNLGTPTGLGFTPRAVAVQGRYAYVVGASNFKIYDISNPTSPSFVGSISNSLLLPLAIVVQGRYAYVSDNTGDLFDIFDVSDPALPTLATTVGTLTSSGTPLGMAISGKYLYVTLSGANIMKIYDVSNLAGVSTVGSVATDAGDAVAVQGRYAYVGNIGGTSAMQIVDIGNPATPTVVGSVPYTTVQPITISVQGRYVYGAGFGNQLQIYDVANVSSPVSLGTVATSNTVYSLTVVGRYAYAQSRSPGALQIFDIGGTYSQSLEVGSLEASNLSVKQSLTVGQSIAVGGALSAMGASIDGSLTTSSNLVTGFLVQNTATGAVFDVDTNNLRVGILTNTPTASLSFGAGASRTINVNAQPTFNTAGDALTITSGTGNGSGAGGAVTIQGGTSGISSGAIGGALNLMGGASNGALGGTGGTVTIQAGNGYTGDVIPKSRIILTGMNNTGLAGNTSIYAGDSSANIWPGGNLSLQAGAGSLTGAGGILSILAGTSGSGATGNGGAISVTGGASASTNGSGGNVTISGGTKTGTGTGGSVIIKPQASNDSLTAIQFQNAAGSVLFNADTINSRLGVNISYAAMSAPTGLTMASTTAGGSLAASTTYYYKVTAIDSAGGETTASTESSIATTGTNKIINMYWTAVSGATGYKIYRSTISGSEVYLRTVQSNYSISTPFADDGTFTQGSSTPPATNTAYVSTNVANGNLQLSVGGLGTPTGQVYVSGTSPSTPINSASGLVLPGATPSGSKSMAIVGKYAYIAEGYTGLLVVDISNPAVPRLVSTTATTTAGYTIAVAGKYAYIGESNGGATRLIQIFDISNPASPTSVGSSASLAATPVSIALIGRYVYVDSVNTLQIVDVANPSTPVITGTVAITGSFDMVVVGRYAYVSNSSANTIQVVDLANPYSPSVVGSTSTGLSCSTPQAISVQGRYAYTVCNNYYLSVIDIGNPSAPAFVSQLNLTNAFASVVLSGRYAYVSGSGFKTIDISNPAAPYIAGNTAATGNSWVAVASGRYMYTLNATSNSMLIYDIGGTYDQSLEAGSAEINNLKVNSDSAIYGNETIQGGLQIGQSLQVSGNIGANGSVLFQNKSNSTAAFQVSDSGGYQILTVNTSNRSLNLFGQVAPSGVGSVGATAGGSLSPSTTYYVQVSGIDGGGGETLPSTEYTVATTGTNLQIPYSWTALNGAVSYRIYFSTTSGSYSNYWTTPTNSFTLSTTSGANIGTPLTQSTFAFTHFSSGNAGNTLQSSVNSTTALQVQNVTGVALFTADTVNSRVSIGSIFTADTVNNRVSIGSIGTAVGQLYVSGQLPTVASTPAIGNIIDSKVQGKYLYALYNPGVGGGLQIYDVSDPANISTTPVGSVVISNATNAFDVQGRYAYVLDGTGSTMKIVDVSNQQSPVVVGSIGTNSPTDVAVAGRYAYVASSSSKTIQVIDIANPTAPNIVASIAVNSASTVYEILINGRYLYVMGEHTSFNNQYLGIYDIGTPGSITHVSTYQHGVGSAVVYSDMAYKNGYVYIVSFARGELYSFNVNNPASISAPSTLTGLGNPRAIGIAGNLAYIPAQTSNRVAVVNIANPASMSIVGSTATGAFQTANINIVGRYGYITASTGNITVIDTGGISSIAVESGSLETNTLTSSGDTTLNGALSVQGSVGIYGSVNLQSGFNSGADSSINGNLLFTQGAARTISVATPVLANTSGYALSIAAGSATGTGSGGALNLQGGASGTGFNAYGGNVNITGGITNASSAGAGGSVTLAGGTSQGVASSNAGGSAIVQGGNAGSSTNGAGGGVTIAAGSGNGTGNGGSISITAGNAGGGANTSELGGAITITAGNNTSSSVQPGRDITLQAGGGGTGNYGGNVILKSGTNGGSAGGGVIVLPGASNDNTKVFQIQNAAGTTFVTADSTNQRLSVGTLGTAAGQLYASTATPTTTVGTTSSISSGTTISQSVSIGDYVYKFSDAATNSMQIINVARPTLPSIVSSFNFSTGKGIAVQGKYMYLYSGGNSLGTYDVSNPASPAGLGGYSLGANLAGGTQNSTPIVVKGNLLYAVAGNGYMQIANISNPSAVVMLLGAGFNTGTSNAQDIAFYGKYMYVGYYTNSTTGTVKIFDISNPASPSLVNTIAGPAWSVKIKGSILYVIGGTTGGGSYSLNDPTAPSIIGGFGSFQQVATGLGGDEAVIAGNYLYLTVGVGVIQVYDISNPASMPAIFTGSATGYQSLTLEGRYLYGLRSNTFDIYDLGGVFSNSIEGGSIEATSIRANGDVSIGGTELIQGSVSIGGSSLLEGDLAVNGSATFKNKTNSTTAFVVQNASYTSLFTVDTQNSVIKIGGVTDYVSFNGTTGEPTLNGTGRHIRKILLTAEYAGAVLDAGTGSSNTGTMTAGNDLTNRENYYKWVTTQATSQSYDVDVQVPLPSDFSAFVSSPTVDTYTEDLTNGTLQIEMRDSSNVVETNANFASITPSSTLAWQTKTLGALTGTYTAGGYLTFRIRMYSTSAVPAGGTRVGNITLNYYSKW